MLLAGQFAWVLRSRREGRGPSERGAGRLTRARAALVTELGPTRAAIAILLAGVGAILAICWPLGALAGALQGPIDVPIFEWTQARVVADHDWTRINELFTKIGDPIQMLATTTVAAVAFGLLWRRRAWWIPAVVLFTTLGVEWYMQMLLGDVVGRGHPPTGTGTFPSGGSARVVAIYGVIFFLALHTWPHISTRSRIVGWTTVGMLAALEGYSRLYLLRHWWTDVPSGWFFGVLLLLVIVAGSAALLAWENRAGVQSRGRVQPSGQWQDPEPLSVNVRPATGMKDQS